MGRGVAGVAGKDKGSRLMEGPPITSEEVNKLVNFNGGWILGCSEEPLEIGETVETDAVIDGENVIGTVIGPGTKEDKENEIKVIGRLLPTKYHPDRVYWYRVALGD